jgi:hypothetical protein
MKKYHLTFLRNGVYQTAFCETTSIEIFLAIEKELGREIHLIYSRELTEDEYKIAKQNNL